MSNIPTPHISAKLGDFADTVIMPGDPLRAKFIAETFLEDAVLVNNVRGVQGYTGTYNGKRVSVMASGMGMPSMAIYAHELFNFYDVKNIIRIGSAGTIQEDVKLYDIVIAMATVTNSSFSKQFGLPSDVNVPSVASYELLKKAEAASEVLEIPAHIGTIFSGDIYYDTMDVALQTKEIGVLCAEMEAAALYYEAMKAGKNALCICTISDDMLTGVETTSEERQYSFTNMMKIALEIA